MTEDSGEPKLLGQGRYRVRGVLGHGAQAETLWAEDTATQAEVAIKRFQVRGAKSWKDVELAEREANVLSRLSHPNLPKYISHFEEDGALFLVMQKIEGVTLAELRAKGALDQATIARFLLDLADTLGYLHALSPPIVHRDIKPQNVILRPDGGFSLVDFGSVRERLKPEGGSTVVGTFGYMAPEQFQGRAGPATDVYGVGATAIACLSGQDPENLPHRGLAIDVPAALGTHVDRAWVELLTQLVEPDPDRRPRALAPALSATIGKKQRVTSAPTAPERRPGSPQPKRQAPKLAERDAKRERKAVRRTLRREQRLARRQGPRQGRAWVWLLGSFLAALYYTGLLGALTAMVERLGVPILLCGLVVFAVRAHRRRAAQNAAALEQGGADPIERSEHERRVSDLLERAQQALQGGAPVEPVSAEAPARQRLAMDRNPSEAQHEAESLEHPPENHRNSRLSR